MLDDVRLVEALVVPSLELHEGARVEHGDVAIVDADDVAAAGHVCRMRMRRHASKSTLSCIDLLARSQPSW
ncbi:MAG TPA: hypothetical protein VHB21_06790 [Minicystis sp.]|nr:hypothetical protein [Minicystis sp.]